MANKISPEQADYLADTAVRLATACSAAEARLRQLAQLGLLADGYHDRLLEVADALKVALTGAKVSVLCSPPPPPDGTEAWKARVGTLEADRKLIKRLDTFGKSLSEWEIAFVEKVTKQLDGGRPMTAPQRLRAEQIDEERVR